jgi:hypothetical protein
VGLQRRLDLLREDLLTSGVDALRAATEERHCAVELEAGQVTRHRVALAVDRDEGGGALLGVLVVLEGHVAAPRHAAHFARVHRPVVFVDHDRVRAAVDVDETAAGQRRVALLDETQPVEAALGRSDRLAEEHVGKQLEELVLHDRGEDRRRGADGHERRRVVGPLPERVDQRAGHGVAGDGQRRDAVLLDGGPHRVGVELWQEDGGGAADQATERAPLGGAVHERRQHQPDGRLALGGQSRHLVLVLDALAGPEVDAAAERPPHVLVPPHDSLRVAGRAARIEDVDVVVAAALEVALRGPGRQRRLVGDGALRQRRAAAVVDSQHVAQEGQPVPDGGDLGSELGLVDEHDGVAVVEQVHELVGHVPVVHVDGHRPQLVGGEHHFDVLEAVVRVDGDVVVPPHALGREVVGQAVGPCLELGEGHPAIAEDERGPVGHHVHRVLDEVRQVVRHLVQ